MYVTSCFGWSERIAPLPLFLLNVLKKSSPFDLGFIYGWFGELSTSALEAPFFSAPSYVISSSTTLQSPYGPIQMQ